MLVVLDGLPDVPAADVVDGLALGVLDLEPLEQRQARLVAEALHVEHLAERDHARVPTDVRRREHRHDRHAVGDLAEVDEVHVGHHVVVCA